MTVQKGSLQPPASLADIAISALAGQGQYGAVTQISDEHDLSRQVVYRIRDAGHQDFMAMSSTFSS